MILKFIEKYIKNLTIEDIISIANKENISLSNDEASIIYNYIKNDYKTLLYGDSDSIFNNLKSRINPTSYSKIKYFFDYYKDKYKNYL